MMCYRPLLEEELIPSLFDAFIRKQTVTQCWRKRGGVWRIEYDPFVDDWSKADYQALLSSLRRTLAGSMYRKSCAAAASAHGCFPLPSSLHAAIRLQSCIFPPIPLWKARPSIMPWAA